MTWEATALQRHLTVEFISKKRLNAPAVRLKPESASPSAEDAVRAPEKLDTDIQAWRLQEDDHNLAVRLVDGYLELRIKAPDDVWVRGLFDACAALQVDARAAYGGLTQPISSIIFRVEDPASIDRWEDRWPRGMKDKADAWVETKCVYSVIPKKGSPVWRDCAPLPGSHFGGALVVWRPLGLPPADDRELGLEDLGFRSLQPTNMESICRAIAFATLAYWIRVYLDGLTEWDEILVRTIGGWLARVIIEGRDINARGKSLEGVCWSPIEDAFSAGELVTFLEKAVHAPRELGVTLAHAVTILERNGIVPGWGAIETLFGVQAKMGIRRAFRAGLDIDMIERMSERYVLDASEHVYLDRESLLKGIGYEHKHDDLVRLWENEPIFVRNKPVNPFRLFAGSQLRVNVQRREFFPSGTPGGVLRYSLLRGLLRPDDEDQHDEYRVLNTFPGFSVKPIAVVDKTIMGRAITMLDRMFGLLTRDNDAQIGWLKKFIAQIIQFPEIKPQVCPILVGGQGIGKSLFGDNLMNALLGSMAGTADAATLAENKFVITPFIGKLITFIDEVRLESRAAINLIKKLVRSDRMSGERKFEHQRDFYVPSRVIIATNSPDIGLSPEDAADRALFFIMAWTAENKRMHENQFLQWALTLKPFYAEFMTALKDLSFKQHLMRYFVETEVKREELEDLKYSSRADEAVIMATMSKPRDLARRIIADARVISGLDITAWFNRMHVREAIKRHEGSRCRIEASEIVSEFERAELIEKMPGDMMRFKWGYGRLLEKTSEAHGLPLGGAWPTRPGPDWEENDVRSAGSAPEWRGNKQGRSSSYQQRRDDDPDYMPPE